MKFVKVVESYDIFSDQGMESKEVDAIINLETIELVRENPNFLTLFLIGREKGIKIVDKDSIKLLKKELKID